MWTASAGADVGGVGGCACDTLCGATSLRDACATLCRCRCGQRGMLGAPVLVPHAYGIDSTPHAYVSQPLSPVCPPPLPVALTGGAGVATQSFTVAWGASPSTGCATRLVGGGVAPPLTSLGDRTTPRCPHPLARHPPGLHLVGCKRRAPVACSGPGGAGLQAAGGTDDVCCLRAVCGVATVCVSGGC